VQGAVLHYLDIIQNGRQATGYACLAASWRSEDEQMMPATDAAQQGLFLLFSHLETAEDGQIKSGRT
jgi:hypothetical protein